MDVTVHNTTSKDKMSKCKTCSLYDKESSNDNWVVCGDMPLEVVQSGSSEKCENYKREYTPDDQIDWESVKWDYENTKCSFKKLGDKYNTYPMNVQRKAKDGGWVKFRPGAKEISQAVAKFDEKQSASSKPTAFLGTVGARKIQEIVHELGLHYSTVDEPLVIAYAESYERYMRLARDVNKEGEVLISPKTGGEYLNPKFNAMQSVKNDLIKFGNQLGLSIAARKKLFIDLSDKEEQKSLFDMVEELSSAEDIDV